MSIDFLQRPRFAGTNLALVTDATATGLLNVVEVDLGSTPRRSGYFDITTTGLTVGQNVIIEQINGPYTGKGTLSDEAEMDQLTVSGQAISSTVIRCYWTSPTYVRGNIKFAYTLVSTLNTVPEATESAPGIAEILTQAEFDAGVDEARFLTALKFRNRKPTGLFVASTTAGQSMPTATSTRINYETEEIDVSAWFVPGTGASQSRFTPIRRGWFAIGGCVLLTGVVDAKQAALEIWKGAGAGASAFYKGIGWWNASGAGNLVGGSGATVVWFNGTDDYVELKFFQDAGSSKTLSTLAGYNYFWGYYIGDTATAAG